MKSQFFTNLSVRNKLISIIMVTAIITLTLALISFNLKEIFNYRRVMKSNLTILTEIVAKNCASALLFNDPDNATETLNYLSTETEIKSAMLFAENNQIFAIYHHKGWSNEDSESVQPTYSDQLVESADQGFFEGLPFFDLYLDILAPVTFDGEKLGHIYIQQSLAKFRHQLINQFLSFLLILAGAAGLAFFLAQRTQRIFTDPITKLVDNIHEISQENNYRIRIEGHYNNEFGILISGFNNMLIQIQKRDNELAVHRDHLEDEVRQRTKDLQTALVDLTKAKEEAEASDRGKSEFLANMSHELRTPLNHIIGFTDLVSSGSYGELNDVQVEFLSDVLNSSQHLLSLINDILDLSKIEAGKMELELEEVHLRPFLEQSLKMVQEKALKHQLQFSLQFRADLDTIQIDERKLKQILYNLLSNATKFTPDGGRITITAEQCDVAGRHLEIPDSEESAPTTGNWLKISIEDSGIGIKKEDLKRIFKSFEQADSSASRHYQGTGLGLSLTRRLVELHGGKIWVESEGLKQGSTFYVLIPKV